MKKKKLGVLALQILFPLITAVALCEFPLEGIESFLYDLRVRLKPASPQSGQVTTVAITKETLKALKSFPTINDYKTVLEKIDSQKPAAIVLMTNLPEINGSEVDQKKFAQYLEQLANFYIPGSSSNYYPPSLRHKLALQEPYENLKLSMGAVLRGRNILAKDNVARRIIITFMEQETLHPFLAKKIQPQNKKFQGVFDYLDTKQIFIDFRPKGTYKPLHFHELLSSDLSNNQFTNKIVIIGIDAETDTNDYVFTPFSREILAMSRLEAQANAFDTLLLNRAPIRWPKWVNQFITFSLAAFTTYAVMALNPTLGLITLLATLIIFTLICYALLAIFGLWINMIHPLLAIFICYYFSIPYRLIVENRRSWEYFQKHKLLKQVEELKTNFLSMMSHDIKTPIARIQGMTEILQSAKEKLSNEENEAVSTIQDSASELSEFISTILDLGRIENQKVKLKLQSKDVNSLLQEVIDKHRFLADKKEIQVICEFEPLFSSKLDVELMRQVFANLIENSIKYSPQKAKVLISTEEAEQKIIIQVADQGQGISPDELENIFMKFYRSKKAKSSTTKGSGLGLYLAKYFVELHQGTLEVESTVGQGSTFTVTLPNI